MTTSNLNEETKMTEKQILKAFHIQGDEYGIVRFATCNVVARREGAQELEEEFSGISCKRMPGADKYAELGKVPGHALVEEFGWWQECAYCQCHVDNETEGRVWDGDTAYCDAECQARWMNHLIDAETERQRIKAAEQEAIEKAIAKFPGITDVIAHQNFNKEIVIYFRFPGGTERASWPLGADSVGVGHGDSEPLKAYLQSIRKDATQ